MGHDIRFRKHTDILILMLQEKWSKKNGTLNSIKVKTDNELYKLLQYTDVDTVLVIHDTDRYMHIIDSRIKIPIYIYRNA